MDDIDFYIVGLLRTALKDSIKQTESLLAQTSARLKDEATLTLKLSTYLEKQEQLYIDVLNRMRELQGKAESDYWEALRQNRKKK